MPSDSLKSLGNHHLARVTHEQRFNDKCLGVIACRITGTKKQFDQTLMRAEVQEKTKNTKIVHFVKDTFLSKKRRVKESKAKA